MLTRSNLPAIVARFMGYQNSISFVACSAGRKFGYVEVTRQGTDNQYVVWVNFDGRGNITLQRGDLTSSQPLELRFANVYQLVRLLRSQRVTEHMNFPGLK